MAVGWSEENKSTLPRHCSLQTTVAPPVTTAGLLQRARPQDGVQTQGTVTSEALPDGQQEVTTVGKSTCC